jgi:hypothetical protein
MGIGLRWQLPQWLLCAVTAAWDGDLTKDLHDSHAATAIITELNTVFATGLKEVMFCSLSCVKTSSGILSYKSQMYRKHALRHIRITKWNAFQMDYMLNIG